MAIITGCFKNIPYRIRYNYIMGNIAGGFSETVITGRTNKLHAYKNNQQDYQYFANHVLNINLPLSANMGAKVETDLSDNSSGASPHFLGNKNTCSSLFGRMGASNK